LGADSGVLSYAVDNRSSFENIKMKWVPEMKHHCPDAKWILVGLKEDLYDADKYGHVSEDDAMQLAFELGADGSKRCSALTQNGLKATFDDGLRAFFAAPLVKPARGTGAGSSLRFRGVFFCIFP
jgi:GTPase SAR1 family protein